MKSFHTFQVNDLKHQVDHITPKKIQIFEKHRKNPAIARVFKTSTRHGKNEMRSDGNKVIEVKVI